MHIHESVAICMWLCSVLVRLSGDNRSSNAGRLEIYFNNTWGTVCSDGFTHRAASVACYMLGFRFSIS